MLFLSIPIEYSVSSLSGPLKNKDFCFGFIFCPEFGNILTAKFLPLGISTLVIEIVRT